MTARARLEHAMERNVALAMIRRRRGLTWAHLSQRQQRIYARWLDTFMGNGRDAAVRSLTRDGRSPTATDATAHRDVRGEDK